VRLDERTSNIFILAGESLIVTIEPDGTVDLPIMNKPNFSDMSREELAAYVMKHRHDNEAFYALADKVYTSPRIRVQSMEQLADLIRAKQQEQTE
jgi:hypothetical protein